METVGKVLQRLLRRSTSAFLPPARQLGTTTTTLQTPSTAEPNPPPFPLLPSQFDPEKNGDTARKNRDFNLPLFAEVRDIRAAIEGADRETQMKERSSRKLTVRERIDLLRDVGSEVFEVGLFAGWKMPYGRVINASNAVTITRIAGETCVVSANIWTFKGGTLYPISVKKQLRAQEIAMENRLPCIYLVDSGGAFLPLQVSVPTSTQQKPHKCIYSDRAGIVLEIPCFRNSLLHCVYAHTHIIPTHSQAEVFPDRYHGGRVFRNQANLSSMGIPQVIIRVYIQWNPSNADTNGRKCPL